MKQDLKHIFLATIPVLLLLFILYILKVFEVGMDISLSNLGVYPMQVKGIKGILLSPLIHSNWKHLFANTIPLFFLGWCLFYFYKDIAWKILVCIWIGCGILTFLIGKPGWHIGASGVIYGLAFFLFFSGILRKHIPLIAISLLVTFLYGSIIWQMFPHFTTSGVSWEGHLSGAVCGTICAILFLNHGPQKPDPFINEDEEEPEDRFWENENEDNDSDKLDKI